MSAVDAENLNESPLTIPEGAHGYFTALCGLGFLMLITGIVGYGVFGARITAGLDGACAEAALDAGQKLEEAGSNNRAIQKYRQALTGNIPDEKERFRCGLAIGDILFREKRYSEALVAYRELPEAQFDSAGAFAGYVGALWNVGETEEAIRLSQPWLALAQAEGNTEQEIWVRKTLIRAAEDDGDFDAAMEHCHRILALAPKDNAALTLAKLRHRKGDTAGAREQAEAFLALSDNPAHTKEARDFLAILNADVAPAGAS